MGDRFPKLGQFIKFIKNITDLKRETAMIIKTIKKRILVPMWYKLRLLQMLARFGEDRFYNVEIEISSQCNFKCSYCPVSKFPRPNGILPTETYKNVIDQLREIGYSGSIAPHLYNEPLLDSRLPDLMGYTRVNYLNVKFYCTLMEVF